MASVQAKRRVGYGLIALFLLSIFAYLRFPGDFTRRYLIAKIGGDRADLAVSLERASLTMPAGLSLERLAIRFRDRGDAAIEVDRARADASLLNLLAGRLSLSIEARAYGGDVRGDVAFVKRFTAGGPLKADMVFERVDLGRCTYLKAGYGRSVEGRLSGNVAFQGRLEDFAAGAGHFEVNLADGFIELQKPLFGMERIDFSRMEGSALLENRTMKIRNLRITGGGFEGDFTGNIFLERVVQKSRLDVKGTLRFTGQSAAAQAVALTGTLEEPQIQPL